jgi:hypothetical protein
MMIQYTKPRITLMVAASVTIQSPAKMESFAENNVLGTAPAYEADE